MQLLDGRLALSATDLVGYLACDHLATLEMGRVAGLWERPHRRDDPTIELIQQKGDLHEAAYLDRLRAEGRTVVEIRKDDLRTANALRAAAKETVDAMRTGADVIFQATFFDGRWRGHADFLFKRPDRPSPAFGTWSYDVADTKLARAVKTGAILQLCVYAGLLAQAQGVEPEWLTVVTGDREEHRYRAEDFAAYFRYIRTRFEARIARDAGDPPGAQTYPNPVDHCRVCAWSPTCIQRRRDDDHLSIVAGLRRVDTERLSQAGIPTLASLAATPRDLEVPGVAGPTLRRLRNQARLQLQERTTGERVWELIEPDPGVSGRGLALLPEPSPWDVFFDIEADPWATDAGLEYLLGIVTVDKGEAVYRPIWGTSADRERTAFAELMDFVMTRLAAHPELHVFHYGGYESGALKRLVGRHGIGSEELDRLLRGETLVDLLNVVRQGVRASVESYSLKQIEKFYLPAREGPVTDAGFSVVKFEEWLREGDDRILGEIADYNRDDCVSTWMLRDWLEARRAEAIARWPDGTWARPTAPPADPSERLTDWIRTVRERIAALTDALDPADGSEGARARRLLADLLDWHRREEKSQYWRWFELQDLSLDALVDERDALSGLEFMAEIGREAKSTIRRYRFEPQDHPFGPGDGAFDAADGKQAGTVVAVDDLSGTIDLKRGDGSQREHPRALIGQPPIDSRAMKGAMLRVADAAIEHGFGDPFPYPAIRDLLFRRRPRLDHGPSAGTALVDPTADVVVEARRLAQALDGTILPIQGPPGTGKTYTAARMIVGLVRQGKRVGVSAQSHKTIGNLLEEVLRAADEPDLTSGASGASGASAALVPIRVVQRAGELDPWVRDPRVRLGTTNAVVDEAVEAGSADIVAGTAWLFSRGELDGALDVLFVDEAGQYALANVIAAGACARSIVLVGDPTQLPMVTQGVHPAGAGLSGLAHLLGEDITFPPERGLFLSTTRRLHPAINTFISETFYDGRVVTHPDTDRVVRGPAGPLSNAGVRWWPVVHEGNAARSAQEAERVADAVAALVGREQVLANGSTRMIEIDDVIVVAPYNAQVSEIQAALGRRLGRGGNVGTVDKFQGREGTVAIYSMTSSSRDDAPRDMSFLYSRNRLNVAVSRAQSIAVIIASPTLLEAGCRTPDQMRLVDALCRFVEVAAAQEATEEEQLGRA